MNEIVEYECDGQELTVTPNDVRTLLCPEATDKEIALFLELCKAQRLNPFTREAYLIKYSDRPATVVVGKDVFTKRAARNPKFQGYKAGVTVRNAEGNVSKRKGSLALLGETIVGGWCEVYVEGYACPMFDEVSFDEYAGRKANGSLNGSWATKPGTMIRKVAIVHALREAFPEDFQGLYDEAEMEPVASSTNEVEDIELEPIEIEAQKEIEMQDPRGTLWEEAAAAREEFLAAGGTEDAIEQWRLGNIHHEDYSPKDKKEYTEDDIRALIEQIRKLADNHCWMNKKPERVNVEINEEVF